MNPIVSMRMEQLSRMLEQVGLRDGIQGLRLSHEGTAALALSGGKELGFEYNQDLELLVLHMPVMNLPVEAGSRLAMMAAMLSQNYLKGGGRGELALDQDGVQAIYQCALPVAILDADMLDREIDQFLAQRELCRHGLEHRRDGLPGARALQVSSARIHPLQRLARS